MLVGGVSRHNPAQVSAACSLHAAVLRVCLACGVFNMAEDFKITQDVTITLYPVVYQCPVVDMAT